MKPECIFAVILTAATWFPEASSGQPMSPVPPCTEAFPKGQISLPLARDQPTVHGEYVTENQTRYPAIVRFRRTPNAKPVIEVYIFNAPGRCQWVTTMEETPAG